MRCSSVETGGQKKTSGPHEPKKEQMSLERRKEKDGTSASPGGLVFKRSHLEVRESKQREMESSEQTRLKRRRRGETIADMPGMAVRRLS